MFKVLRFARTTTMAGVLGLALMPLAHARIVAIDIDLPIDQVSAQQPGIKIGDHHRARVFYNTTQIDAKTGMVKPLHMQHLVGKQWIPTRLDPVQMPMADSWLDLRHKPYRYHYHSAVVEMGEAVIVDFDGPSAHMSIRRQSDNGVLVAAPCIIDPTPVADANAYTLTAAPPAYVMHDVAVTLDESIIIDADEKTQRLSIRSQDDRKGVLISGRYSIDPSATGGPEAEAAATRVMLTTGAAHATSNILIPSGTKDAKKEEANRALVLDFWANFFGGHADEWRKWLSPDFVNHDPFEPSGGEAFSKFMLAQAAARRPPPAAPGASPAVAPQAPSAKRSPDRLFLLADGDLVMIVYPGSKPEDLTENVHGNIVRVIDGKITDWWLIGWFPEREAKEPRIGDGKKGTQPRTSN